MTVKQELRNNFEKKTGEKAILKFKKTKTFMFNDNYTEDLEKELIKVLNKVDDMNKKIGGSIDANTKNS